MAISLIRSYAFRLLSMEICQSIVYSESPTTRDNMIARITITLQNIPSEILRKAVNHLTHRIHLCPRL